MTSIQSLVSKKDKLCTERDLCAELYNVWITKLHDVQEDEDQYNMYLQMIANLEPYGQMIKEQIREINRKICDHYGVDSIEKTPHMKDCVAKFGFDRPNRD
ncbi:MAG: hypothetical protein CME65_02370 [Halobacteriovoraceae bacterium]|nr:hypothetical protein [Halobacteriovoraceae bacterium]